MKKFLLSVTLLTISTLFILAWENHPAAKTSTFSSNLSTRNFGVGSDIDAKVSGSTQVYTADTESFHPYLFHVENVDAVGVTVPAVVSIGTNSPDYNNMVSSLTLPYGDDVIKTAFLDTNYKAIPGNTQIYVKVVSTSVATTHKFRVGFLGHGNWP